MRLRRNSAYHLSRDRYISVEVVAVGHSDGPIRPDDVLVFNNDNAGVDDLDGVPYPVIGAVEIYGEQINFTLKAVFDEQVVYVVAGYPRMDERWRINIGAGVSLIEHLTLLDCGLIAIDQQTVPPMIDKQICSVAFNSRSRTNLDARLIGGSDD